MPLPSEDRKLAPHYDYTASNQRFEVPKSAEDGFKVGPNRINVILSICASPGVRPKFRAVNHLNAIASLQGDFREDAEVGKEVFSERIMNE